MTTFAQLPLHAIVPSPTNPRKHFDQAALNKLSPKQGQDHETM